MLRDANVIDCIRVNKNSQASWVISSRTHALVGMLKVPLFVSKAGHSHLISLSVTSIAENQTSKKSSVCFYSESFSNRWVLRNTVMNTICSQYFYYSWNVTNHMRPTISGPDLPYQASTYNIRPWPTISGPQTKLRFRSCSKRFSSCTVSKIHEHFDQQNGTKLFFPQLCVIPFTICQVSSKVVKQRRSTWPLRRRYSWSRWIMSNSRRSKVLCFITRNTRISFRKAHL